MPWRGYDEQNYKHSHLRNVRVQMGAAPINPADLNQIEGKYSVRPELPATPGFEGAGIVGDTGRNVSLGGWAWDASVEGRFSK
ncbi:MAG: hypothetical protein DME75_12975 [Verrucomicrobia bacterium]|nr:MAG: hypothetical protein DME75_12975 [Verrucomicrobiota bacterium]